jgi:hypothetical protein
MDLGKSIFEYGQSYVALSRIRSLNGLYLSEFYPHRIKSNPLVKQFYHGLKPIPAMAATSKPTSTTDFCFEDYRYIEENEREPVATNIIVAEAIAEPIVMATIDTSCSGFTGTSPMPPMPMPTSNIKIVKL